ncbi:Uncharacterised protein [Citrobacter werkmanii]|uniref:Transcriptional regulator n=1 Tax=Citrobacter werkmanii TaxID=67827 RepID=A0ABM8N5N6_9ENTR|nr:Uncharacterised protein [Citrobacter werkmanii]CAC9255098.1 Uncharacterised protein [Citrobacter werkmanii]
MQNHHEGCCKHTEHQHEGCCKGEGHHHESRHSEHHAGCCKVKSIATQAVTGNITTNRVRTPPRSRRRWWSSPVHLRH